MVTLGGWGSCTESSSAGHALAPPALPSHRALLSALPWRCLGGPCPPGRGFVLCHHSVRPLRACEECVAIVTQHPKQTETISSPVTSTNSILATLDDHHWKKKIMLSKSCVGRGWRDRDLRPTEFSAKFLLIKLTFPRLSIIAWGCRKVASVRSLFNS